jgi:hypothetical protein
VGRPRVPQEVRALIRQMSLANRLWGSPRIHGELLKLGVEVAQSTVAKYMVEHRRPPSQRWATFLRKIVRGLLQRGANASVVGQGHTAQAAYRAAGRSQAA